MKILYTTDLHGHKIRYEKLLNIHISYDLMIIGGDILPKHTNNHSDQFRFFDYLVEFFNRLEIPLIIDFANDDHIVYYNDFKELVSDFKNVFTHHCNEVIIDDISFIGLNNVPDYPFGLKDWCLSDNKVHTQSIVQYGKPCLSTINGYKNIEDLYDYFNRLPTLEEKLNRLPIPTKEKVINIFHAPPRNLGLDICSDGRAVGSYAVTDYIAKKEPMICYSGHIHESPNMSRLFWNEVGNTICIQPGQAFDDNLLIYCSLDIDEIKESLILNKL